MGIDVHKESWYVTVRSNGEKIFNGRIPGQHQSLKEILKRYHDAHIKVAYEAGPFGFWLLDRLTQDGFETTVVSPSLIPVESGNKVKTDKRGQPEAGYTAGKQYAQARSCTDARRTGAPGSAPDPKADR